MNYFDNRLLSNDMTLQNFWIWTAVPWNGDIWSMLVKFFGNEKWAPESKGKLKHAQMMEVGQREWS